MSILGFLRKNKIVGLIFLFIALIVISIGTIFYLDSFSNQQSSIIRSELKGYDSFKSEIIANSNYSEGTSNRIKSYLNILENSKTTEKEKYEALNNLSKIFSLIYSNTNDPKYRPIFDLMDTFAKNNFPKLYKESDHKILCMDPGCAESPQPKEILEIINKIKTSNLPERYKEGIEMELINAGYLPDKYSNIKFDDYYSNLTFIKIYLDKSASKDTQIQEAHDKLRDFLEKNYPKELEERERPPENNQ